MLINVCLRRPLALVAVLLTAFNAFGWGQKGHDVTAAIAERHLTPAARAAGRVRAGNGVAVGYIFGVSV